MKIYKHVIAVILIYLLFSFVGIGLFVFFTSPVPEEFAFYATEYKIYEALLVFLKFLPSLLLSAFLVGLSWSFGRSDSEKVERFSTIRVAFFKNVIALSFTCIALSMFASEIFIPLLQNKQENMENKEKNFEAYLLLAAESAYADDFIYAKYYIDNALALKPNAVEALDLKDTIDIFYSGMKQKIRDREMQEQVSSSISVKDYGYTSPQLMERAREAFLKKDFFNAHYYASLLLEMTEKKDGNRQEAQQLAADAWNKLQDNPTGLDGEQVLAYETKRKGYVAFINQEFEKAYYIFSDLKTAYPSDLDIDRYFLLSKEKMDGKYFFSNEVEDLINFEQYKNVYFSIKKPEGGFFLLYWKGGTAKEKAGNLIQYMRELNVFSYDENKELEFSFSVPYAKLVAFPLEQTAQAFQADMHNRFKMKKESSQFVPLIYLVSTDSEKDGLYLGPSFSYEREVGSNHYNSLLLAMPFDDFLQICKASLGVKVMPLTVLASFAKKADSYGFSKEVYFQTFMDRMSYPFVLLIVLILLAGISWNYKLGTETHFKFVWLITLPLFTFILYFVLETILYLLNLFSFVIIGIFGGVAPWVYLLILCVLVLLSAIIFSALRSD